MKFQGKSVLIIGDSLSESENTPGGQLKVLVEKAGAVVAIDAKRGRSPYSYFKFESGAEKLKAYRAQSPDLVIVFLGTNSTNLPSQWKDLATWPTKVVCFSPPSLEGAYAKRVARDHVVRRQKKYFSRWVNLVPLCQGVPREKDRVHFTPKGAAILARRLYDLLSTQKVVQKAPQNLRLASLFTTYPLLWIVERRNRLRGQG